MGSIQLAIVRDGDPTTTGGVVIAKSAAISDDGRMWALDGPPDGATCGNCPGIYPIRGTGYSSTEEGRPAVVPGNLVLCPCGKNFVLASPDSRSTTNVDVDHLGVPLIASGSAYGYFLQFGGIPLPGHIPDGTYTPATPYPGTPALGDASAFEYQPSSPDGESMELAGAEGTPRNNQAQNKQTDDVAGILRLSPDQAQQLHHEISGEGLGFHEIMERAKDMFNLR